MSLWNSSGLHKKGSVQMLRIVAYDITSPKRLRRVAIACLDYGIRIEKSVFECDLRNDQFEELLERLKGIVNRDVDSLVCYSICAACEKNVITYGPLRHLEPSNIRVFD